MLRDPLLRISVFFLIAIAILISVTRPQFHGDASEYTLMTVALANHGTPDITAADAHDAGAVFPWFAWHQAAIADHLSRGTPLPPGFLRGEDGKVHAIHSFGYSAAAVVPMKLASMIGANPAKCFLWVDSLALLLLVYSAYGFFRSAAKAFIPVALMVTTVGCSYWNWGSPELYSASLALSALLLIARSRSVLAGLAIGLAGMQNPPLLSLLFFGPLFMIADARFEQPSRNILGVIKDFIGGKMAAGTLLGLAIGLSPVYFSFKYFGTWNVIAKGATDSRLVSLLRLHSYYFDLNQGLIIAIPGVLLLVALLAARYRRVALMLVPIAACSLVLAVPSLSTQNWNSGAAGMMRYVVWGAVPFLFLLLLAIRQLTTLPAWLPILFLAVQLPFTVHATKYTHMAFSPLALWALEHVPALYNPEPEIFIDRSSHGEPMVDYDTVYRFGSGEKRKTLYYDGSYRAIAQLCPTGLPSAGSVVRASYDGWTYLNGPVTCSARALVIRKLGIEAFSRTSGARIGSGWSRFEFGTEEQSGIWSIGKESTLYLEVPKTGLNALSIHGVYGQGNLSTEVIVNGRALGKWHLDRPNRISLESVEHHGTLEVTLKHAAPKAPSDVDTRELAFFMKQVVIASQEDR
ncbi:hypothetical protein [Pseudoduganella lutea]|uniref:Uncharacterized protein n=1 Tax=Pseudoduganella lutea TaxID=321985 RepID=A0A4P6L429_9BURK|nr:hypothetical protein [Pseudoduganella lutea]QBE65582.1 hypothetical protein EWM63_23460 [Pseudoduganella lutea]